MHENPILFPLSSVPCSGNVEINLNVRVGFDNVKYLTSGSNSDIFTATFRGESVVLKVIKEDINADAIALHEFDMEFDVLYRLSHPNIIRVLGIGNAPRKFLVLENLSGGTLHSILDAHEHKPGIVGRLFTKPSFTYVSLISYALSIARAFNYLHNLWNKDAMIIHRGDQLQCVC